MAKQRRIPLSSQDEFNDTSEKYGKIRNEERKTKLRLMILSISALLCLVIILFKSRYGSKHDIVTDKRSNISGNTRGVIQQNQNKSKKNGLSLTNDVGHVGDETDEIAGSSQKLRLSLIEEEVERFDREVRRIKATPHIIMEKDKLGIAAATRLQEATRELILLKYSTGKGDTTDQPFRVRIDLEFQDTMPDFKEKGPNGSLLFELAPISLVPHSVYTFLEIARKFRQGAFHRNAGHVLQATVPGIGVPNLAFQEYSDKYPHKKGTVGYAGRPSGPAFYISIQDNTKNHGPGSQQEENPYEADSIIGRVIEGFQDVALDRIHRMPGKGFIMDKKRQVIIKSMTILVPNKIDGKLEYTAWKEPHYVN